MHDYNHENMDEREIRRLTGAEEAARAKRIQSLHDRYNDRAKAIRELWKPGDRCILSGTKGTFVGLDYYPGMRIDCRYKVRVRWDSKQGNPKYKGSHVGLSEFFQSAERIANSPSDDAPASPEEEEVSGYY